MELGNVEAALMLKQRAEATSLTSILNPKCVNYWSKYKSMYSLVVRSSTPFYLSEPSHERYQNLEPAVVVGQMQDPIAGLIQHAAAFASSAHATLQPPGYVFRQQQLTVPVRGIGLHRADHALPVGKNDLIMCGPGRGVTGRILQSCGQQGARRGAIAQQHHPRVLS
jgi:hypothetical protein